MLDGVSRGNLQVHALLYYVYPHSIEAPDQFDMIFPIQVIYEERAQLKESLKSNHLYYHDYIIGCSSARGTRTQEAYPYDNTTNEHNPKCWS